MRQLRLLIIAIATICVLALGVFALVNQSKPDPDPGDDIIIKGGSLEIQCGANQGADCLGTNDNVGKYKHKQSGKHITKVVVNDSSGVKVFDSSILPTFGNKPTITLTYK